MQNASHAQVSESDPQFDVVRTTADRMVERVGRDAAVRMCRSNMWLGVLAEIERAQHN